LHRHVVVWSGLFIGMHMFDMCLTTLVFLRLEWHSIVLFSRLRHGCVVLFLWDSYDKQYVYVRPYTTVNHPPLYTMSAVRGL